MSSIESHRWSLRGRLLRPIIAAAALIWLSSAALVVSVAESEEAEDWDIALLRSGRSLLSFLQPELHSKGGHFAQRARTQTFNFEGFMVQVWSVDGRLLLRSSQAPGTRIMASHVGFDTVWIDGHEWRAVATWDDDGQTELLIAERAERPRGEAMRLAMSMAVPVIVGLPLIALIAWAFARRALQPLIASSRQVADRAAGDLTAIPDSEMPSEVRPLVEGFNALLIKLADAFEHERRFAGHVAHELRTPLATIRLNAELLLGGHIDASQRATARRVIDSVDRCTQVLEQLLTLARLDARTLDAEPFDLQRIAHECADEFSVRLAARQLRIALESSGTAGHGPQQAAYIVLRNLIENAVRHANDGGRIHVRTAQSEQAWSIVVEDDGRGFDPDTADANPSAFSLDNGSTRLGLLLVRRIGEALGASLSLDRSPELGGARASLRFPAR